MNAHVLEIFPLNTAYRHSMYLFYFILFPTVIVKTLFKSIRVHVVCTLCCVNVSTIYTDRSSGAHDCYFTPAVVSASCLYNQLTVQRHHFEHSRFSAIIISWCSSCSSDTCAGIVVQTVIWIIRQNIHSQNTSTSLFSSPIRRWSGLNPSPLNIY